MLKSAAESSRPDRGLSIATAESPGPSTVMFLERHFGSDGVPLMRPRPWFDRWSAPEPACAVRTGSCESRGASQISRAPTDRAQNTLRQRWCCAGVIVVRRHEWRADTR